MKYNIGIDIDGCLNNFQDALGEILKRDYNIIINKSEYENMTPLGYTRIEEYRDFWNKYNEELFELTKINLNASEVIKKLKEKHIIYIITAREYNVAGLTEQWLNKYKIVYDKLYFAAADKIDVCNWKNINFMIEDKPSNALTLAENGIKVILYDQPYNKKVIHPNIVRCKDWNDIFDHISKDLF